MLASLINGLVTDLLCLTAATWSADFLQLLQAPHERGRMDAKKCRCEANKVLLQFGIEVRHNVEGQRYDVFLAFA